jgi:hypothetical protein
MNTAMIGRLSDVNPPWVYVADTDGQEFGEVLGLLREQGYVVADLDCSRMLNLDQLFDAFAEVAEFPDYFGRNWPAFDECLADLEWLPGTGYVFVLRSVLRLLEQEPAERAAFWRIVAKVAAEWSEPVSLGEWWDRAGTPFHFVLELPDNIIPSTGGRRVSVGGVEATVLTP